MIHHKRTACRVCHNKELRPFLSLGPTPLANAFLKSPDEFDHEASYPLDVYFCETCSLVQLLDVIDPETLFRNYIYVTGTSETMIAHNQQYAQTLVDFLQLSANDLVIEVASNDGSLLQCFKPYSVRTIGIEPAANIADLARANGIETISQFLNTTTAKSIRDSYGPANLVIANNVLAHVDETQDFLSGCKSLVKDNGLIVIEAPSLRDLLDRLEYDTIYHEHLCYFSVGTLIHLCNAVGLSIVRMDHVPVHGGSLRMYAGTQAYYGDHAEDVLAWADEERRTGLTRAACYERFATAVQTNRQALRTLLERLTGAGKTIAGYGAPAKGNTLLNYCGIDTRLVPYTVDKNPMKVGLYTPGMHLPVLPVATVLERQPDYLMILAWNFADEIIRQQQAYRVRGGRFIIPIPEPGIV